MDSDHRLQAGVETFDRKNHDVHVRKDGNKWIASCRVGGITLLEGKMASTVADAIDNWKIRYREVVGS